MPFVHTGMTHVVQYEEGGNGEGRTSAHPVLGEWTAKRCPVEAGLQDRMRSDFTGSVTESMNIDLLCLSGP